MKELRRRLALARELWATSKHGRREVAIYRRLGDERPLAAGALRGLGLRGARVGSARVAWSAVERIESSPPARCENCLREHGPLEVCLIGAIAGVIVVRGTREVTPELLARVHVDQFWDRFCGPAVDGLEEHLSWLEANDAL